MWTDTFVFISAGRRNSDPQRRGVPTGHPPCSLPDEAAPQNYERTPQPPQNPLGVGAQPRGGGGDGGGGGLFFGSRRRRGRFTGDWGADGCSADLRWASGVPSNISQAPPASRTFGSPTSSAMKFGMARGVCQMAVSWLSPRRLYQMDPTSGSSRVPRSEERRVGTECRSPCSPHP